MTIALVTLDLGFEPFPNTQLTGALPFKSMDEALQSSYLDGIVLGARTTQHFAEGVHAILNHPEHYLIPVFSAHDHGALVSTLSEGYTPDWAIIQKRTLQISQLRNVLQHLPKEVDFEERLLRWLYVRPEYEISPLVRPGSAQFYVYPLLTMIHPEPDKINSWINSLKARRLIEEKGLIDRIRLCGECGKAHLNYIDRCPNCQSINIAQHDFLHCFACGYVAPENEFLEGHHLNCPKCRAQMRHIGADYDRPLENLQCKSCSNVFSDAEVVSRCMDCGRIAPPESLEVTRITKYAMTEEGRLIVRNGTLKDVYAIFDEERFATRKHFELSLNWVRDMFRRYNTPHFTMVHFSVENVGELVDTIGRAGTVVLLEEFSKRLRTIMRETDIPVRLEEHRIIILMPNTNKEKAQLAIKRLAEMSGGAKVLQEAQLQISFGILAIPEDSDARESAPVLIAQLIAIQSGVIS